jgi:hypothetical protein
MSYLGSDTKRYYIYLPVLLLIAFSITLKAIIDKIRTRKLQLFLLFSIIVLFIPYFTIVGSEEQGHVKNLAYTQAYSPSKCGVASIAEVGNWLRVNSDKNAIIFGTAISEFEYYSNRQVISVPELFFLSKEKIKYYFNLLDINYIIVRQNQILADETWNHLEKYPVSFYLKIKELYPLVYKSSCKDVEVYVVSK